MFLISKCCAGIKCRYRNNGYLRKILSEKGQQEDFLAMCPEVLGGLPTPREGCSVIDDKVIGRRTGTDYTAAYKKGAKKTLLACKRLGITRAYLLANSPSCGKDYGITAKLLEEEGIEVISI